MTLYTIDDFRLIPILNVSPDIQDILHAIEKNIVIPTDAELAETQSVLKRRPPAIAKRRPPTEAKNSRFKPTNMMNQTLSEHEQQMKEIRSSLNKLSARNYETQQPILHEQISTALLSNSGTELLDILMSNRAMTELYVDLLASLSNPTLEEELHRQLESFVDSLREIQSVDPNTDYDSFCLYNKKNDRRKSYAAFFAMSMRKGILERDSMLRLLEQLLGFVMVYKDQEGKVSEVEEITENIFVLMTCAAREMMNSELWAQTVGPLFKTVASLKAKDHTSLSSRAVFKYMDMVESLQTN